MAVNMKDLYENSGKIFKQEDRYSVEFSIKNVLPFLAIYFTPKFGVGKIGFW